jgi:DNA-binding MarR family transcriptional regulator
MSDSNVPLDVLGVLMRFMNLSSFWSNAALRKLPFDHLDFQILSLISDVKKIPEKALITLIGEKAPKVAMRLKKLQEHQLVTVQSGDKNQVVLTDRGREFVSEVYSRSKLASAIQSLSAEEQSTLQGLFQKINQDGKFDYEETFGVIPFAGIGIYSL